MNKTALVFDHGVKNTTVFSAEATPVPKAAAKTAILNLFTQFTIYPSQRTFKMFSNFIW